MYEISTGYHACWVPTAGDDDTGTSKLQFLPPGSGVKGTRPLICDFADSCGSDLLCEWFPKAGVANFTYFHLGDYLSRGLGDAVYMGNTQEKYPAYLMPVGPTNALNF